MMSLKINIEKGVGNDLFFESKLWISVSKNLNTRDQ